MLGITVTDTTCQFGPIRPTDEEPKDLERCVPECHNECSTRDCQR